MKTTIATILVLACAAVALAAGNSVTPPVGPLSINITSSSAPAVIPLGPHQGHVTLVGQPPNTHKIIDFPFLTPTGTATEVASTVGPLFFCIPGGIPHVQMTMMYHMGPPKTVVIYHEGEEVARGTW